MVNGYLVDKLKIFNPVFFAVRVFSNCSNYFATVRIDKFHVNSLPLFIFVIRLDDPLVSLYIADTIFRDRDDRLTIHVDVSIFRCRWKLDSLCQFNQLCLAG